MKKILILIISVIVISCSLQKDENPKVFVIVDSLSFNCTFPLLTWYDDGIYYNSDMSDNKIRLYKNGENINSFGGSGQGPGEFSNNIVILTLTEEKLVALTMIPDRITSFTKNGDFLSSHKIVSDEMLVVINGLYYLNDKLIVQAIAISEKGEQIRYMGELTLDGRITKFSESELPENNSYFAFNDYTAISQQLVSCKNKSLHFNELDQTVSLEDIPNKIITPKFKEFIKTCDNYDPNKKLPVTFPIFKQIFELDQRIFVQTQYQYYSAKMYNTNTIYELDLDSGKFTEVVFPQKLDLTKPFITNNNQFIILDSDNEKIFEYVVKYL